uniref:Uncharacterized protein n=1 Tax=Anguilla anguilla TaxID=7936 RepID=A0A0E9Y0T9_ANGAN
MPALSLHIFKMLLLPELSVNSSNNLAHHSLSASL